jgi:uncharacterized membrane protein YhaH (DUF805 family)
MFQNPFSFEGRIRRTEFGISLIIYAVAYGILSAIAASGGEGGAVVILIFLIPMLWFLWAQGAKRSHDVGNSGWLQLIPFYVLWLLFQDGQPGPNQYGINPKGIQAIGGQNYQGGQNTGTTGGYQGGYIGGHNNPTNNYNSTQNPSNSDGYKDGDLYK